jgi:hypothetical protein
VESNHLQATTQKKGKKRKALSLHQCISLEVIFFSEKINTRRRRRRRRRS